MIDYYLPDLRIFINTLYFLELEIVPTVYLQVAKKEVISFLTN
jgi:hypothetical protein